MKFHWYWPFARQEEVDWALGTPRPGETIVVQTINRTPAPQAGVYGPVTVVRDLPDINRNVRRVFWLPSRFNTYVRRAAARQAMWRSKQFDLVHLHYLNRFTDAIVPLPTPLVMSVHDVVPHVTRLGRAEHALLHRTYHRADGLVVHHQVLSDRLVQEFGVARDRVHVVEHQVFHAPDVGPPPGDREPMVLFFGALRANKGLPVLLEAMRRIPRADVRLVIAGRGDADLEALARGAAGTDPRIVAEVGFVPLERKRQLFAEASVSVLPYTSFASQSGVLHDAYSHGRPVVVTDVGALGSTVVAEGTGLVARPGDPDSLARQILHVLEPTTWRKLADATQVVRSERSPERTGQRLRSVYDQVLSGR